MPDRTDIEWEYEPTDFFEAEYLYECPDYTISCDAGHVIATLIVPRRPVDTPLMGRTQNNVQNVFLVRQVQTGRRYRLGSRRICYHENGAGHYNIEMAGSASIVVAASSTDIIVRDKEGKIVHDTKAERIAEHARILDEVSVKASDHPVLYGMLSSYSQSLEDASNVFVHLYEVRDALQHYFRSEENAQNALAIPESEWKRIGLLANAEPLREGRHRGKHYDTARVASHEEVNDAREIVKRWILAFAKTI